MLRFLMLKSKAKNPVLNRASLHRELRLELLECRKLFAIMNPTFLLHEPSALGTTVHPNGSSAPTGLSPNVMRKAYGVDVTQFGTVAGDGTGQVIAIVDAYDLPSAATDLTAFSKQYGLPEARLVKLGQTGGTTLPKTDAKGGWGVETALDIEWAHAIAPNATILLVEANSASDADLYKAVDTARNYPGVSVVSMSWGADETSTDSVNDLHFKTPAGHNGVAFVSSSGDAGAYSDVNSSTKIVSYPAVSPNVVAVGGTRLTTSSGTYVSETGWGSGTTSGTNGGSGGGISKYFVQPKYQVGTVTQSPKFRTLPDIAMDADPASGASVYDAYDNGPSTPWISVGGTSLASPMFGGVVAIVDQGRALNGLPTLDSLTGLLPAIYAANTADFHDITTGNNGYAAGPGYDLVTGRGTPIVNRFVSDLAGNTTSPGQPGIGAFAVNPTSISVGSTFTLTASNVTELGGTISKVAFYQESNGSSGLQAGADALLGQATQSGTTWSFSASSTDLAAGTYTYYAVATDANNVNSAVVSAVLTVTSNNGSSPTIGSLAANPTSVVSGAPFALTAANVTATNATIANVTFYRESNGTSGLQVATDTLVGQGTQSGTSWSIQVASTDLPAGTYTYYAIATDSGNSASLAASTTLIVTSATNNGVLVGWDVTGQSGFGTQGLQAKDVAPGIAVTNGLTRGKGLSTIGSAASNAWGASSFSATSAAAISSGDYISFGFTVGAGQTASLSSIDLNYRHSSSGPANGLWQYQINTGGWTTIADIANEFPSSASTGGAIAKLDVSKIAALNNISAGTLVGIRVVPYGSSATTGTWYVNDKTGDDFIVSGSVVQTPTFAPSFSNAVKNAIKLVPTTAGAIASTSVVNFGTTVYKGSLNVANTLNRIRLNGKSVDANDGSSYSNANHQLPTGTWYEFVVDPKTGTDHNFGSKIAFPGPMRLLISSNGMVYFSGDHYATFSLVYKPPGVKVALSASSMRSDSNESGSIGNISYVDDYFAHVAFCADIE
jgi:ribonuclease